MNESIKKMYRDGMSASKIFMLLKKHVSRSGVFKGVKRLKETGTSMPRVKSTSERPVRKKTHQKYRERSRRNPARSARKLAQEAHVSPSTMQRLLKNDLNLKTYKVTKTQLLSEATKKKLEREKLIL